MRWFLPVLLVFGCSSQSTPASDTVDEADDVGTNLEVADPPLCAAGSIQGCTDDQTGVIQCSDDGMMWAPVACLDDQGLPTLCLDGACLQCFPGTRRCVDEDTVEMCNEEGNGWAHHHSCNGVSTGQVCETGTCIGLCALSIKWNTYMGCEYWAADLDNGYEEDGINAAGAQYALIVSNPHPTIPVDISISDSEGPVTLDSDGDPFPSSKLLPGTLRVYRLPRRDVDGTMLADRAYRVQTSIPTTVYQFNPLANEEVYSNDASLLLPINVLDRWYYVMSREQGFEGIRAYFTVVGTHDDTDVTVTVSSETTPGDGIPALQPGESLTRQLHAFDVLNVETLAIGDDLTGSQIVSSRRVAVFGGSEGANVPNTNHCDEAKGFCEEDGTTPCASHLDCKELITCCADHIEEQLFPVDTWGTHYLCVRTKPRGEELESWRIMAAAANTVIELIPSFVNVPVLNAGEWFEFEYVGNFEVVATKPVLVGQFMQSEYAPNPALQPGDAGIGDPAFMLVVPLAQYRTEYVFLAPPDFEQSWINVMSLMGSEVLLDGSVLPQSDCTPFGVGTHCSRTVEVNPGVHALSSAQAVGLSVYAYDSFVSYGYPGGLDLKKMDLLKPPFADEAPDSQ